MEDNVSKIKDRLDVVDVISGYLKLQKAGMNFKARCPFHNEKTPSFVVSPERQVWHCFGCSKGGDIFSFVQDIEGVEFPEALKILASKAGIELDFFNPAVKDDKARLYEVCEAATKFFEKQFYSSTGKLALEYLKNRGVTDPTIKEFRLGFAPNDWSALGTFLKNCGYSETEIVESGLAIKRNDGSGIYDRFRSRITFPVFDFSDRVVGFSGRIFSAEGGSVSGGEIEQAKYINTPQTRIYDKSGVLYGLNKSRIEIKRSDSCILVEGNMDALMSYQAGVKNVVASSGTALTHGENSHLRLIKRYTTNLCLCLDLDKAGDMATKKSILLALGEGFNVTGIEIQDKECKDPADLIKKNPLVWAQTATEAKPILEVIFSRALSNFDRLSVEGKKSIINEVAPFIKKLATYTEKNYWIGQLAIALRIKEEVIANDIQISKEELDVIETGQNKIQLPTETDVLNGTLLSLVMKNPIFFKNDIKNINLELLDPHTTKAIIRLTEINSDNIADLLKDFRDKNQSYKMEFAYLKSQEFWKDSRDEDLKIEFNNLINKLEERYLRAKLEKIGFEIRDGESKEKKLVLATEANKILSRLGEIQKI